MNELLVAAREYRVRHGWSTIPVVDKDAVVKWSRYQRTKPREAELVNWFGNGNHFTGIAVIMGKVSGGLCCRDFDDPPAYKAWYDHFPDLADSLSTSFGREGHANVYCIAKPESFKAVRQTLGCKGTGAIALGDGELRGDVGCITVLPPSKHPDGHQYRWRGPWHQIPAVDLRAAGFVPASAIKRASAHKQLPESAVIAKSAVSTVSVVCQPVFYQCWPQIELAIAKTLPEKPGECNRQIFDFARELKAIPAVAKAEPATLKPLVMQWHRAALPRIPTKEFEQTWFDFCMAWDRIKFAAGEEPIATLFKTAISREPPQAAAQYDSPQLRALTALCRELQADAGEKPFYLAGRTAAALIGAEHKQVAQWLRLLVFDKVLRVVCVGSRHKASEYRYLADL